MITTDKPNLYRRLLHDAWRTAWRCKHLWVFGFFATFAGFGSISEIFFHSFDQLISAPSRWGWFGSPIYRLPGVAMLGAFAHGSPLPILTTVLFLIAAAVFCGVFVWATVVSIGALIGAADLVHRNRTVPFGEGVRMGAFRFWPLFWLLIGSKAAIAVALCVTGANLVALVRDASAMNGLVFLASFVFFTAAAIAVSVTAVFGSVEVVLRGIPVRQACQTGWRVFRRNWLLAVETMLLLLGANLALGLVTVAAMLILSVPFVFLTMLAAFLGLKTLIGVLIGLGAAVLLAVIVAYGSFMTVFQVTAWTRLYTEITAGASNSWLHRLLGWLGFDRK